MSEEEDSFEDGRSSDYEASSEEEFNDDDDIYYEMTMIMCK